jgi:hypothetical protein
VDYDKFMDEWNSMDPADKPVYEIDFSKVPGKKRLPLQGKHAKDDRWLRIANMFEGNPEDRVNSPSHYTAGSQEAIVTIEEAIEHAPSVSYGFLQAQVLKYLLRVWHKDNPLEDLKKAQWYLNRLIQKMDGGV